MPVLVKSLSSNWNFACVTNYKGRPELPDMMPATVPGTVHTDLMATGHLADPYIDLNEIRQDWVGWQNWAYACGFDWKKLDATRHDIVFDGLDTFAEIALNGKKIGSTKNMHRSYRFNITDMLKVGNNSLNLEFTSPRKVGEALEQRTKTRPNSYPSNANLMRKAAYDFGWDWGPSMATSGIWKGCRIESWSVARFNVIRPEIILKGNRGHIKIKFQIERDGVTDEDLTIITEIAGIKVKTIVAAGDREGKIELDVENPEVWWPHNLGDQPLYELSLELIKGRSNPLDIWERKVGFRSLRLDTSEDETGSAFTFVINDVPVFIMGASWIPDDSFLTRVTPKRYLNRITQAKDANINMLRVWGGGIYETDAFYEACDALGILVWQDFLFACAAYPEEGDLPDEIAQEARENVIRLMAHPSLVLWNGNNENIWGWFDWGWKTPLDGNSWGEGYYLDMLPKIVAELDPTRPYWAGSPYSGSMNLHPNDPDHGCNHEWKVWNETGYQEYRNYVPRFMSEFGWQAPPTWSTLTESINDDPLAPTSPGVMHHQKATDGSEKLLRGLKGHLPDPKNMDDWHFVTQLNQARAMRFGIEHLRSHRPTCMGCIIWQLNDCWPVTSWSAIDGYGRKKPLWHALKSAYAPHLLTIQPRGKYPHDLKLIAINDSTLFWRAPVKLQRVRFDGTVLAEFDFWRLGVDRMDVKEMMIPPDIATAENPREEMIIATMQNSTAHWFFNEDVDLDLPEPEAEVRVEEDGDDWLAGEDWLVHVTAKTFLRDACLMIDRIHPDAEIDTMMVNLLPGETKIFKVKTAAELNVQILASPPVFRCSNQLKNDSDGGF